MQGGFGDARDRLGGYSSFQKDDSPETIGWAWPCKHPQGEGSLAVVLDPFMGSGTTCAVARALGLKSIGIDLNADYLDIALKHRLAQGQLL